MTHSCNHCKTDFRQRRRNQFYCGQSCRQLAYIERKYVATPIEARPADNATGLARLLGNLDPAVLMKALTAAVNNPSMTDKLTDKSGSPVKHHDKGYNPSQNVNSETPQTAKNSADPYEEYLKTLQSKHEIPSSNNANSIFDRMIAHKLTISIPPKGYVRSLFPHWENRAWELSLQVNQKMMNVFEALRRASTKNKITSKQRILYYNQMKELQEGLYALFLPEDYPFYTFIRLLTGRLAMLVDKAKGREEIKFHVPEELSKMMMVLTVQLETQ